MGYVYVVTNSELGWDCVVGVYEDEDFARQKHDGEFEHIFPMQVDDLKAKTQIESEESVKYEVKSFKDVKDFYMIVDSCGICTPEYYEKNNIESISYYSELFDEFCVINQVDCGNIYITQYEKPDGSLGGWLSYCDGLNPDPRVMPENYKSKSGYDLDYDFTEWVESTYGVEVH